MWDADEDFQEPVPNNPGSREGTEVIEVEPVIRDPGSFIRRHLNRQLAAARQVRDDVRATNMGTELMSRFPTLASQHTRPRTINRQTQDRRRNASVKVQMTALDDPRITTTNNIKMQALLSKNLGRREDTTFQMVLSTTMPDLRRKVTELFPPLSSTDFHIMLGRRPCQLVHVEANTLEDIKRLAPKGILRLWVRPTTLVPTSTDQEATAPANNAVHVTQAPTSDAGTTPSTPTNSESSSSTPTNTESSSSTPTNTESSSSTPTNTESSSSTPTNTEPSSSAPTNTEPSSSAPTNTESLSSTPTNTETPPPLDDSLHLELETSMDDDIVYGTEQMKMRVQGVAQPIVVRRETVLEDLVDLYRDIVDVTRPVHVTYLGEEGQDLGGITKDVFSQFWDSAFRVYFKGEGVCVPFLPINRRQEAREVFPILGRVLEHFISLFGSFPLRFSRCAILAMSDPDQEVDEDMLMEDFLKFLPESDRDLLEHALSEASWPVVVRRQLELFFTLHGMTVLPTSENLSRCLLNLAQVELLDKPATYLRMMRKGITPFAMTTFFERLNADCLRRFLSAFQPDKDKLVSMLLDLSDSSQLNPQQEVVLYYLIALVRDFSGGQLRHFLRWVTGTETMPESLSITFNSVYGAARRPVAHTCGNVLELSNEYDSYQDFKEEMLTYIFSEEAFRFTMM